MTASLRKRDRIREHLIALIEERAVGQAIPAERQIAAQLEVSRPTLRSVVDELIRDGWLVREHGRGVFVAAPKIAQRVLGGSADGGATYPPAPGTWTSRVLDHSVVPAGQAIGSRLRTDAATPILRITRQRLTDGAPIAVETIHLLHALVADLDPAEVESGSLYALLRSRYGVVPTEAEQRNEAAAADSMQAALLGIADGAPVLTLERVTTDQDGRPFEFTRAAYRGDRYCMVSRLDLTGTSGTARIVPTQPAS